MTLTVSDSDASVTVTLSDSENLLDEVVLSASKTAQSLFESPVTIERFDYKDIAASTGADFYQSLEQLKGVQVITTGIINQTVNARGFSTAWNEGFVQVVDGMNNEGDFFIGNKRVSSSTGQEKTFDAPVPVSYTHLTLPTNREV